MRPPRDRITCLLIGNHSAGKSSFTNWYVGEQIQKESVAIETAGITIIRKGEKARISTYEIVVRVCVHTNLCVCTQTHAHTEGPPHCGTHTNKP